MQNKKLSHDKHISLKAASAYIQELDLNYIVESMCSTQYILPRWSFSDAAYCCHLYKNFLLLQKIHITEKLVPTREIDEFWHNHILHTQKYVQDCMNIFGCYLHHSPASPNEDTTELINNYQRTKELYFREFNKPLSLIKENISAVNIK